MAGRVEEVRNLEFNVLSDSPLRLVALVISPRAQSPLIPLKSQRCPGVGGNRRRSKQGWAVGGRQVSVSGKLGISYQ